MSFKVTLNVLSYKLSLWLLTLSIIILFIYSPKKFLMLRVFNYMSLTAPTKVIVKHKALIFKQQFKVTLKIELKILASYVAKTLPMWNIF